MTAGSILLAVLGVIAVIVVGVFALVYLVVPLFKGLWWLINHVFSFIVGEIKDALRFVGAIVLSLVYIPLVVGNVVIGRWSASAHYGRALQSEGGTMLLCLYRVAIGHPFRLVGLGGVTEGLERRLPAVIAAAPTSDTPGRRTGQFEGYNSVGSLAGGGSGAKLYVAEPDEVKSAALSRMGFADVGQVVIKAFSLHDGSSLPQIVRESRSLDAAKRLGLILDHELLPERFYYVMRYVPGESLSLVAKRLHAGSPADGLADTQLRAALSYACDLVSTLSTYHRGGLWHKDVKPDNIIVDGRRDGRAHLVDFGLVSSLRSAMTLTTHGTEYFRDPEMVRLALKGVKVHEVDGTRFDIYGAGAVLYSVIEDSFPAHGVLSQVTRRCPESVKWIIRRAMTDYDKRYSSAEEMLADLRVVATAGNPFALRPVDLPSMRGAQLETPAPEPISEAPWPQAAAAAVGAAAVGAAAGAPPIPGAGVEPPPFGAARQVPKIRVTNWWSGRAVVEGRREVPPHMGQKDWPKAAAQWAEQSAKAAKETVRAVVDGVNSGLGRSPVVEPPVVPARHSAQPRTPREGPRVSAADQLKSARARVASARRRAHERMTGRRGAERSFKPGVNGGVATAVAVFLGGIAFVGIMVTMNSRGRDRADRLSADITARGPQIVMLENGSMVPALRTSAPPDAIPEAEGRVLLVNDVMQPWSQAVGARIKDLLANLQETGLSVTGNALYEPAPEGTDGEDIEAIATLRLALGQSPVDSSETPAKFSRWFSEHQGVADLIVWIAPGLDAKSDMPRVFIFVPRAEDPDETSRLAEVQAAVTGAVLVANRDRQ